VYISLTHFFNCFGLLLDSGNVFPFNLYDHKLMSEFDLSWVQFELVSIFTTTRKSLHRNQF